MTLRIFDAIMAEQNTTVEAAQRAQARALHLGVLLLAVRDELGKAKWEFWIRYGYPIPAGATRMKPNG